MKLIITTLAITFLLGSCKKETTPTCSLSPSSLNGEWTITAATYKATSTATPVDDYASWTVCDKDDLYVMDANNTFSIERSPTCGTPDQGIYTLTGNNIILSINSGGGDLIGVISNFTCNSFILTETIDSATGESETYTFKKS